MILIKNRKIGIWNFIDFFRLGLTIETPTKLFFSKE